MMFMRIWAWLYLFTRLIWLMFLWLVPFHIYVTGFPYETGCRSERGFKDCIRHFRKLKYCRMGLNNFFAEILRRSMSLDANNFDMKHIFFLLLISIQKMHFLAPITCRTLFLRHLTCCTILNLTNQELCIYHISN